VAEIQIHEGQEQALVQLHKLHMANVTGIVFVFAFRDEQNHDWLSKSVENQLQN
jgi:hypothetical protein